jgi:eukaryotic-like serine/threonine-protein kinase
MIGQTIRQYRIESKLGEGGMGIVYRAYDLNLNRPVALKILLPDKVTDVERKRRFVQEARMASALNHPNIVTVHDIASEAGVDFIVMEYIRGRTLDQVVPRRGLRVGEALRYAAQVADALAAAHAADIIHRDLKPSNVMILDDGRAKVLDFGLAKLTEPESADDEATRTLGTVAPLTEEGKIVGTLAYMSPEQAQGNKLDLRSDVFSFGSLLFEMLTGRRVFQRETKAATLSAILRDEPPPMSELAPEVPREVENLVLRCLRKDVRRRPQHFGDLKLALEELREQSESGTLAAPPGTSRRIHWPVWAALLGLVLVCASLAGWKLLWRPSTVPESGPVLTRLTSDAGLTTDPAISSDGKLLAYASDRAGKGNLDIWVQQMAGGEPLRLTTGPADNRQPDFSPDGTRIVFRSDREGGGIYIVSTFGGAVRLLAKRGITPRFSPDGQSVAYQVVNSLACKIYVVPAAGGESRQLDPTFADAHSPVWSPDGKSVLVTGRVKPEMPIDLWYTLPADGSKAREIAARDRLMRAGVQLSGTSGTIGGWLRPAGAAKDDLVLFTGKVRDTTNVWQLSLDRSTAQPAGDPVKLTLGQNERLPRSAPNDAPGKRIVFAAVEINDDLYAVSLDANRGVAAGEPQRLTENLASDRNPYLSTDGRTLLYESWQGGAADLRKQSFPDRVDAAFGFAALKPNEPILSHDGIKLAFDTAERKELYLASAGGYPNKICDDCGIPLDFSWDNKLILYAPGSFRTINCLDVASGAKTVLLRHPSRSLFGARFSPAGDLIAFYTVNPVLEVWIAPYRPGQETPMTEWIKITSAEKPEVSPGWSPDGKLLYYLSDQDGFRCVWAQRIAARKPSGPPFAVSHFHNARRKPRTTEASVVDLTVARDKIVVSLLEQTGNIWLATR